MTQIDGHRIGGTNRQSGGKIMDRQRRYVHRFRVDGSRLRIGLETKLSLEQLCVRSPAIAGALGERRDSEIEVLWGADPLGGDSAHETVGVCGETPRVDFFHARIEQAVYRGPAPAAPSTLGQRSQARHRHYRQVLTTRQPLGDPGGDAKTGETAWTATKRKRIQLAQRQAPLSQ